MKDNQISLREKLSYGGGDAATCIIFGVTNAYLSYYYTDIAGISLASVGIILAAGRLLEAGTNIFTGIGIDRSTSRFGKIKPFLYTTTFPMMLMFFILFIIPDISQQGKTVFAFVSYFLFCLFYAINNTSYSTLLSMMTSNATERKIANNYRMTGCGLGGAIASFCTLPLVALIGSEGQYQFASTALLYAIIGFILLMNCSIVCKERVKLQQEKIEFKQAIRCAVKSQSWIVLCLICVFSYIANILRSQSIIYYAKYCLGKESIASILLTMSTASMLITSPFLAKVNTKLGTQKSMFFGFSGYIIFTLGMYFSEDNIVLLILCTFLSSVCTNFASSPMYAFCSDTMDEVEYKTGTRPQGVMTSVMMCFAKIGIALAGIIFSQVLDMGGYVADAVQTPAAINAIHWNLFWIPILSMGICLLLAFFYRLDKNHKRYVAALEARNK
ncbi:MAG: glycoside-pentoside-hexuronide (GPH):cation symporter [Ruminococcus sp.]|nr:glycoside-pentoside-hexuronide (GPH):cation symporter [Ruminococcus sp.]